MDQDILAPEAAAVAEYQETDVFAWANNITRFKGELKIDLFLVDKRYMLYKASLTQDLRKMLEPLFLDGIIEYILTNAEVGLIVRGFEDAEAQEGVLQRTQLFKVDRAREVIQLLKTSERELEIFNDAEHDFARIKGIIARVRHPDIDHAMYVCKVLPQTNVMRGRSGWLLREGKFVPFDAEGAVRVPPENQLLILDQDIYVFNQQKLKQLFSYDAKEALIAEQQVAAIEANFRLSYAEGLTMQNLVAGKRSLIKKLQTIDPLRVKQQELLDHAEELGIELMENDAGAIIIMDAKDLTKFVNLLNDDYVESNLTGQRYEIIRKKPMKETVDSPEAGASGLSE